MNPRTALSLLLAVGTTVAAATVGAADLRHIPVDLGGAAAPRVPFGDH
jgi:hypothetical protein